MSTLKEKVFSVCGVDVSVKGLEELFRVDRVERNIFEAVNCDFIEMVSGEFGGSFRSVVRMTDIVKEGDENLKVSTYVFFGEGRESAARKVYESGRYDEDRADRVFVGVGDFVLVNGMELWKMD